MKFLIFVLAMTTVNNVFADGSLAGVSEVNAFCTGIDAEMEAQQVDMALDTQQCLSTRMTIFSDLDGTVISAILTFRSPNRQDGFPLLCQGVLVNGVLNASTLECESATVIADQPATLAQVKTICDALDAQMEAEEADMALDVKLCYNADMAVHVNENGSFTVFGLLPFNAPNRPSFTQDCQVDFVDGNIDTNTFQCL